MIPTQSIHFYRSGDRCRSEQRAGRLRPDRRGASASAGSVTLDDTTDSDVGNLGWSFGPLVHVKFAPWLALCQRLQSLTPSDNPAGGNEPIRRSPVMGGIGYTLGPPKTLVNFSVVVEFNRGVLPGRFPRRGRQLNQKLKTSFAFRPGISVTRRSATRVGFTALADYMVDPGRVTLPEQHRPAGPGSLGAPIPIV